jgi:curved DNA-binding protein CbpA
MANADLTRDYYADLEVATNASENEIRKAFRALALQYHPDRNPGHETKFVLKFQEIQAAHEILCDKLQRAKYDVDRRKYQERDKNTFKTSRTRSPPSACNAYTTTTPTPPKPSPRQHYASHANGANRFANNKYRASPTAHRSDTRTKSAGARANVFTAWEKVKQPRADVKARTQNPGTHTKQNNWSQKSNPNDTPLGRSQSTRASSSKKGFNPGTPGGDEGQAPSAYKNYVRPGSTPPRSSTPPHPSLPPKDNQTHEVPYTEGIRTRAPYYTDTTGEQKSMFGSYDKSAGIRNLPTSLNEPNSCTYTGSFADSSRKQQHDAYSGKPNRAFPHIYADSSDEGSRSNVLQEATKHGEPPPATWSQNEFTTPQSQQSNILPGNMPNSVNMNLAPSDWHGKFESMTDYFASNLRIDSAAVGQNSRSSSKLTQQTATVGKQHSDQSMGQLPVSPSPKLTVQCPYYPISSPPPGPAPNLNFPLHAEPAVQAAKFKPEEWDNYFKKPSWIFSEKLSQDQSEPPRSMKYQGTVDDGEEGDTDVMDIDSSTLPVQNTETPSATSQTTSAPIKGQYRNSIGTIPIGAFNKAKSCASDLEGVTAALMDNTFAAPKISSIGLEGNSEDLSSSSETLEANLNKFNRTHTLEFPNLPLPPASPITYSEILVDVYLSRFETYCKEYINTTKKVTSYFVTRNAELSGSIDDRFAHHRAETTKKLGFVGYMAKIKDDNKVLEMWQASQKEHIKAMEQCEKVRIKIMELYQTQVAPL